MQVLKPDCMETKLDRLWCEHRESVRRMLIGLTRNIDLADDLLQETYIRAAGAIGRFRDGDARAWLSTIGRNIFYAQARRKYYSSEVRFDDDVDIASEHGPGSADHLNSIRLRRAIADLPEAARSALILRHYGGFTYAEIAERLSCPVGTAQQRVWTALRKLRAALGEVKEVAAMKCEELMGRPMIDFIYGRLEAEEAEKVRKHLDECPSCRKEADEIAEVLRLMDTVEADHKITCILELDDDGIPTSYFYMTMPNDSDEPKDILDGHTGMGAGFDLKYFSVQGEPVDLELDPEQSSEEMLQYKVHLPRPLAPRERIEMMVVGRPPAPPDEIRKLEDDLWRIGPLKLSFSEQLLYTMAVRLPSQARLEQATPEPQQVRKNGTTTIVWRGEIPPDGDREFWLEYRR